MENERIDFRDAKYPETVTLKTVGEEIQGDIVEVGEVTLEARNARYLHIKTKDGIRTFWLGKVLTKQCEKVGIKVGDYIAIKYLGEVPSGKQSPYKNYDMRVIQQAFITEIDTGGIEG
jgi:DNA helicase TIP49 (TBP-interacting protein)